LNAKIAKELKGVEMGNVETLRAMMYKHDLPPDVDALSHEVIGAAIEVHRELGPGLLEKIYEEALAHELALRGIQVERQVDVPIYYKDVQIRGQRLDLLVQRSIIVEIKALASLQECHPAQLLSQLRAARLPLGLLFNFHASMLKHGMKRIVNERVAPARPLIPTPSPTS
jgi:GxxExxY protein